MKNSKGENKMPVEFKVSFLFLLVREIERLPLLDHTEIKANIKEQLLQQKEPAELIDTFVMNWNKIAKTFPDAILPQTYNIEKLIQIWADYHHLELQLEEIKV
jgi:hypothetical protein